LTQHARGDLDDGAEDRHIAEQVLDGLEDRLPEAAHETVARGIGEVERAVADVRVAVPALRGEWALGGRIRGAEASQQRVVDAPVHVHEADLVELLVTGEATVGLAGDGPLGTILSVRYSKVERKLLHFDSILGDSIKDYSVRSL
jgi:hypothetical protein